MHFIFADEVERKLARDLNLSLVLEDKLEDDVQIGSQRIKVRTDVDAWIDDEEDDANSDDNHRILGDLCEDSEEEDTLQIGNQSGSGRWSSFSWSSLYDRTGTDSSLSWAEDVRTPGKRLISMISLIMLHFRSLRRRQPKEFNRCLTKLMTFFIPTKMLGDPVFPTRFLNECEIWKFKFPHLRVIGRSITSSRSLSRAKTSP